MLIYKCAIKEKREIDNRVDAAAARKVFSTQWSKLQTLECPGQMISSFVQNNFTLMFSQNTNMISNIKKIIIRHPHVGRYISENTFNLKFYNLPDKVQPMPYTIAISC